MQTQSPHTATSAGRRRWLAALLGAGLALSAGLTQAADPAGTVRVGFQKAGLLAVLKAQGALDKPLAELGYKVEWKEFPAGPQLLEALNTGSIDFGYTGAPPAVFAQAAGARLVYVGAEPGGKTNEALFVLDSSPAHSVADLKGKRIALQKGSSSNYLLVQLLRRANLTVQDIQPIYLPPAEARAAFESGAVDAWVVWDPYYALAQKALKTRTLGDFSELPVFNFYEATPEFVNTHPRAVNAILAQLRTAGLWVNQHPQETAALLAPKLGIQQPVVETWLRRVPYGVTPVTPQIVASQQQIADLFLQQKLIPKPVNVQSAVWQASFPVAGL
jgi:sulfonate transport system substrate-binding protein